MNKPESLTIKNLESAFAGESMAHIKYRYFAQLCHAAGAMLFVISHEMVPESHRSGNEGTATFGLPTGFVTTLVLTRSFV